MKIPVTMTDMPPVTQVEGILRDLWRHYRRIGKLSRKERWVNIRLIVTRSQHWLVDIDPRYGPPDGGFVAAGIVPFEKFPARELARALIATCAEQALKWEKEIEDAHRLEAGNGDWWTRVHG